MGLREIAGEMARGAAGVWKGVAEIVDPPTRPAPPPPAAPADPVGAGPVGAGPVGAGPLDNRADTTSDAEGVEELPGRMVVPIDTWSRILEQVGHVHEAGQQLAEARERAARAETENRFLREQLAELKKGRPRRAPAAPAAPAAAGSTDPAGTATGAVASRIDRVRRRASGWLSP